MQRSCTVDLRKRVPEEAASHVRYKIFCTHFFDVAKKTSSEQNSIFNPYTSGSEKACEKSAKKVVRASLDLSVIYTIPLYKTYKFERSLTVGDFVRHQNACFVRKFIRLPTRIFYFSCFSCFFDEPREGRIPGRNKRGSLRRAKFGNERHLSLFACISRALHD